MMYYDAFRHLFQWLGLLLVKGNAALLLNRIPSFHLPELDGDMYFLSSYAEVLFKFALYVVFSEKDVFAHCIHGENFIKFI